MQDIQQAQFFWGVWIQRNGMGWNVDRLDVFNRFSPPHMTTSAQRTPLNKDHPNLIAKYLASMVKHVNHLKE